MQCKGSLIMCFAFALFGGLVLYCLQYFLCLLLHIEAVYVIALDICGRFPFIPYSPGSGVVFCVLVCMCIALFLRGSVRVYDDEIVVGGCGKTIWIPLKSFHHIEVKNARITLSLFPVFIWKCYLYYTEGAAVKRCRLFYFNDRIANELNNRIRIKLTQQMDFESKTEIANSVDSGLYGESLLADTKFTLDHDHLFAKEASSLRFRLSLCGMTGTICLLCVLLCRDVPSLNQYELWMLGMLMLLSIPIEVVLLRRRKAICPSCIAISSAGVTIDGKYFSYSMIDRIQLKKVKNTPAYPSQHYMVIQADTREKYWLGSDASYSEYASLCSTIQKAMLLFPEKLEYRHILL